MSMTQIVVGAALGFILAQGALYLLKHLIRWVARSDRGTLSRFWLALAGGLVRHGALIATGAAVLTLGGWAIGDFMMAKSAGKSAASATETAATPSAADAEESSDETPALASAPKVEPPVTVAAAGVDPYADPGFKVQRRAHRAGTLKEAILKRSEARARADLLKETQLHLTRSQYDCEAADRAARYLQAGLDVWGFSAWQLKYFPLNAYKGATLAPCKRIKSVVDPAAIELQTTVAQETARPHA